MPPFLLIMSIKKILYHAQFLQLDEEEFAEDSAKYKSLFLRDLKDYCFKNNILFETEGAEEEKEENSSPKKPQRTCELFNNAGVKKLYRALAFKFHPDKHPDDLEAQEIFKQLSSAQDNCDLVNLLSIAANQGVDELIEEIEPLIQKCLDEKESKIKQLKKNLFYQYYYMSEEERQKCINEVAGPYKKQE